MSRANAGRAARSSRAGDQSTEAKRNLRRQRRRRLAESYLRLTSSLAVLAILALVAAVAVEVSGRASHRAETARERAATRVLETATRAGATSSSLSRSAARDKSTLEHVLVAEIAELRQAAAALEDPEISEIVEAMPTTEGALARLEPRALEIVALRSRQVLAAASAADVSAAADRRHVTVATLTAVSLALLALVAAALPSLVRTRRFSDANLLKWHPADTIEERILKTNGQFSHLVTLTSSQFADQVDKARSLTDLERALEVKFSAEAALHKEVLAHLDEIESLKVAQLRDPMTGVLSYKYLITRLLKAIDDFISSDEPFVLLALDLDDFKLINDRHSHALGDVALVRFARLLTENAGEGRIVFRKSGDEFYILIPAGTRAEGEALSESLLEIVNGAEVSYTDADGTDSTEIATSIGVLDCLEMDREHLAAQGDDDRFLQTISWADAALQRAKSSGKGCQKSYRTGMTRAVSAEEYPPMLDAVTRAVPVRYPNLPAEAKTRFNALLDGLVDLVLPRRA